MYAQAEAIREASTPGRYEGLTAFDAWLCENALADSSWWDEDAGDTDWHYWGARIGRRVILVDSVGFHRVTRYASEDAATKAFARRFADWYAWSEVEDFQNHETDASELSDAARAMLASEGVFVADESSDLIGEAVTVDGYRGVAFRIDAHDTHAQEVQAHMVGDDRTFTFDIDDVTRVDEDDFCGVCGQIGCAHDGRAE